MLVLTNEDIEPLVNMGECIDSLEIAYGALGRRQAVDTPRQDGIVDDEGHAGAIYSLKTMAGSLPAVGMAAVRINSDIIHWPIEDGFQRRVRIPASKGGRYNGVVLLFSTGTGELLALLTDGYLSMTRVGAASGLAARYLAREEARVMGLLGSGQEASAHVRAMASVRKLDLVKIYSPTKSRRDAFATSYSEILGVEVRSVESPQEAAREVDILVSATNSMTPTVAREWLHPGLHVANVRASELSADVLGVVDKLVVNTREPTAAYTGRGRSEVIPEFVNGDYTPPSTGHADILQVPTLEEVVTGRSEGRMSDAEITCFHNFKGLGVQFAAVGALIYKKACNEGVGMKIDDKLLSQVLHP